MTGRWGEQAIESERTDCVIADCPLLDEGECCIGTGTMDDAMQTSSRSPSQCVAAACAAARAQAQAQAQASSSPYSRARSASYLRCALPPSSCRSTVSAAHSDSAGMGGRPGRAGRAPVTPVCRADQNQI